MGVSSYCRSCLSIIRKSQYTTEKRRESYKVKNHVNDFTKNEDAHLNYCFYMRFTGAKSRCKGLDKRFKKYYPDMGILFLWKSYSDFKNDMHADFINHVKKYGLDNTTLDRIDNSGNYCKENCRWATRVEQQSNRRNTVFVTINGEKIARSILCKNKGVCLNTFLKRVNVQKMSVEEAVSIPSKRGSYKKLPL